MIVLVYVGLDNEAAYRTTAALISGEVGERSWPEMREESAAREELDTACREALERPGLRAYLPIMEQEYIVALEVKCDHDIGLSNRPNAEPDGTS